MSIPSLHGSLTPRPRDRDVRAGTASLATAGAVLLAVIAAALVPGSPIYALVSAAGVALGATTVVTQLRHRHAPRIYQWLSALGGVVILGIGMIVGIARLGSSPILATAGMTASFYLMPAAALACYVGGLGQLPLKWAGPTLLATGGAGTVAWLSLGADTTFTTILIVVAAVMSIAGCIFPLVRAVRKPPTTLPGWIIPVPAIMMILLMVYTMGQAVLPAQVPWPWLSPVIVAWTYLVSGVLATLAGLLTSSRS